MDDFYTHIHPYPRLLAGPPRVHSLGYFRAKDHATRGRCAHTSLSLIWSGAGRFACDGRRWPIKAPCAVWEPDGARVDYGPEPRWEEFFIAWRSEDTGQLERAGLLDRGRQGWPIRVRGEIAALASRLATLARQPAAPGNADRIDRLAEQLAAEAVLGAPVGHDDPLGEALADLQRGIDADPMAPVDAAGLARRFGCHPETVARRWRALVGEPLARYRLRQRLRRAAVLLATGDGPVSEVAAACGFADPLHFSRRFAGEFARSPRAYRRRFRMAG